MVDKISKGDFINVDYTGSEKDTGRVFDTTNEVLAKKENIYNEDSKFGTITLVVGAGHVLPGLDKELTSLSVGDKKKITISKEDAFGSKDSDLVKLVPRSVFKRSRMNPVPGMPVEVGGRQGIVKTVSGGRINVDFNHPLAGKELEYEIEVKGKVTDQKEKVLSFFYLHLPKLDLKDLDIKISSGIAEIRTPNDENTRRYISMVKPIISRDILNYISEIKRITFIDVFE
ncbi:TPA: FKBP-type peptidyl-prolyl cis-trans isomerase [archaeon]|jgi:FKBP-type peptidyl-prolyl cis-trans isomerase SlyD|uniref:Peptidyl-prolyl cis-trans isomerase n=1 Tax=Candidatus Undinarchaeum marinum TaxID=2756141 RepID=A0A832UXT3_9ARCH|nr:FKBP-type peptidyl-prolyl cis-trans isomerase [Candidatus Undinarchaeum marinum]